MAVPTIPTTVVEGYDPLFPCTNELLFPFDAFEDIEHSLCLAGAAVGAMDLSEHDFNVFRTFAVNLAMPTTPRLLQNTAANPPPAMAQSDTTSNLLTAQGSFGTGAAALSTLTYELLSPASAPTTESQDACSPLLEADSELAELDKEWSPPSSRRNSSTPLLPQVPGSREDASISGDDLDLLSPECETVSNVEWSRLMTASNVDQGHYGTDIPFELIHPHHSLYVWPLPLLTMGSSPWIRLTRTVLKRQLRKDQLEDARKARRRLKQQTYSRVWRSRHSTV